ncbi:MAG: tRNA (adenosine(37)-N6)-threonylcarbamoyltransferase complex ATPase subunit type 1 TsaE [Chlamydiae bacterium RIFCSPHIGHO2_12_FULL_44_59]|nr:MAG: tRNA (adenosine(37)-N6)-threonylcarbamoyltransferase complex ATPase subunit type 1 TsaE [Chlamydiae bacterium RIFCSPHIGHO2_01_FULL_44_39]OGN58685.1 MAG: tRNA (adenosine(37)-N6)-threonylcarbamoyltransferase complex ATPase subunit type 1 TsaE [Chlamydiae bacterium RIFCSPHIGHO2_02_FULL_45_9]OGN60485.1 MAG: tRNA (adenosine(37)-N6)-threonylcarbamoyltransferase complex ATPase subunit type 1 TsaE [Chlamydiae bacterium RIFCSPHIGHO2_12_FULL_44_59]OGN66606.1 MAG: tRNA (adenosine(37)-N6)-threonylca
MGRIRLVLGTYPLPTQEATLAFGRRIGREILKNTVLALYGDLGAGKTTFVKGLALGLNILEPIHSPTFVLLNLYEGLAHFDLYRLKNSQDFLQLGFEEHFHNDVVTAIEWPDRILDLLPEKTLYIFFRYQGTGRIADVTYRSSSLTERSLC